MQTLYDIFNSTFFEKVETRTDFSNVEIDDVFAFFEKHGKDPSLDYSAVVSLASNAYGRRNFNSYRVLRNSFSDNSSAQNTIFCNAFTKVLPTIKQVRTRYL